MDHPKPLWPQDYASFFPDKVGKTTLFESERMMVGLNAFDPGQEHELHTHDEMDKVCSVLSGTGEFLLDDGGHAMEAGMSLIVPAGAAHGIKNTGKDRMVILVVLAPPA